MVLYDMMPMAASFGSFDNEAPVFNRGSILKMANARRPPTVRKDFPETWIWEALKADSRFVQRSFCFGENQLVKIA